MRIIKLGERDVALFYFQLAIKILSQNQSLNNKTISLFHSFDYSYQEQSKLKVGGDFPT